MSTVTVIDRSRGPRAFDRPATNSIDVVNKARLTQLRNAAQGRDAKGILRLALDHDHAARELVEHVGLAALEFVLPAAQLLEALLVALDLLGAALEVRELVLRLLHLRLQFLGRGVFVVKIENVFGAVSHDVAQSIN